MTGRGWRWLIGSLSCSLTSVGIDSGSVLLALRRSTACAFGFELFGLLGNSACGDETRFAVLNEHPELAELVGQDYWLFDHDTPAPTVGLMRYDDEGHFLGADVSRDAEVIDRCHRWRELALAHSIGVHAYLMAYPPEWAPSLDDPLQARRA